MFAFRSLSGRIGLGLGVIGTALCLVPGYRAQAQADPIQVDPQTLMGGLSALEVAQYEQAAIEHLDYLPNQVLVKFKDGVTAAEAQRALMALRSRPDVNDIRWAGPVAVID